jgi:hypothetical protein
MTIKELENNTNGWLKIVNKKTGKKVKKKQGEI